MNVDLQLMSDDELNSKFCSLDEILALAEPWLLDFGDIVVDQTLADERRGGRIREMVRTTLEKYVIGANSIMEVALCQRFKYCSQKQKFKSRIDLVKAVCDALCMSLTGVPIPIILIAAFVVEEGYCDRLCKCDEHI